MTGPCISDDGWECLIPVADVPYIPTTIPEFTQLADDGCPNCPEHVGATLPTYRVCRWQGKMLPLPATIVSDELAAAAMKRRADAVLQLLGAWNR